MSNSLDPDQARRPDLGPNHLQKLSADNILVGKELKNYFFLGNFSQVFVDC